VSGSPWRQAGRRRSPSRIVSIQRINAGRLVWKLVQISVAEDSPSQLLSYRLDKERLRIVRRQEGRYLQRSNLIGMDPAQLWELYIQWPTNAAVVQTF
jgi:hypothetical protein